jgi:hypothetical protein
MEDLEGFNLLEPSTNFTAYHFCSNSLPNMRQITRHYKGTAQHIQPGSPANINALHFDLIQVIMLVVLVLFLCVTGVSSRIRVSHSSSYGVFIFWDITLCSLPKVN